MIYTQVVIIMLNISIFLQAMDAQILYRTLKGLLEEEDRLKAREVLIWSQFNLHPAKYIA